MAKRSRALLLLLAAGLAVAPTATAQSPAPARGSASVAFSGEATVIDPTKTSAGIDLFFIAQIFEPLVRRDASGKQVNWLAESWQVIENGGKPIIDVHIRRGVRFHNGDPLTARDFEFAFERLRDPKVSRFSHLQAPVERFEVVDDHHFRLHFSEPDATYVVDDLRLWAIPKDYFQKVGEAAFLRAPVGTGPWKFVSWSVKEQLVLEAFDGYWNTEQRPGVKSLTIKIIPEDLTRVAAFQTGAVDWIDAVPASMVETIQKLPGVQTRSMPSGSNLFVQFNTQMDGSPFRDVRVRQAAAHAIDVDAIVKNVLLGQGERYEQIGRGSTGYDPDLLPYAFDPQQARALLREAGYPNGFDVPCYNLTTPREPNLKEVGEAMFAYLTAVGIRCKVRGLEYQAWLNLGRRGRGAPPEMDGIVHWLWAHGLPGDPGTPWAGHVHSFVEGKGWGSYSFTSDPELDRLIEEQRRELDPAAREALLRRIARIKHERVLGGLPTYRPIVTFAWRGEKLTWNPWPAGSWRAFQEIGLVK